MGNVSGKLEDRPALYLRDQSRLSLVSLEVTNARKKVVARITPNSFPATGVFVKRDHGDESLIEYVQDPDPNTPGPMLLLKLVNDGELTFRFTFNIRQREDMSGNMVDTNLNGLTFITGSSHKSLENLMTREFHADPNLHRNPNVELVGDYSTGGSSAVQFEWSWKWRPPQGVDDKGNGLRSVCGFVEYDQRAHRLTTLAQFACWVQSTRSLLTPNLSALSASFELKPSPKLRITPTLADFAEEDKALDFQEPPSPFEVPYDTSHFMNTTPSVKVDCQRPAESLVTEDGPLFRATIKSLEQKTGALRARMKKVLKQAERAKQAQVACNESLELFMESLREAASSNATGIQPALDHYYERTFRAILSFEKQNEVSLQRLIIEPLTKLYNIDIKQAEAKRKEFEEESRDYYNYVGRYLGIRNNDLKQKKKVESDSKYQIKRRNFELKRFDYCSFMEDLHGGRKEQEILSQLTKFADAQAKSYLATASKVQELMPQLEALNFEVKETDKEFQLQRTEREERRRQLETSQKAYVEPDSVPFVHSQVTSGREPNGADGALRSETTASIRTVSAGMGSDNPSSVASGATPLTSSPPPLGGFGSPNNRFKGIRDLQENDRSGVEDSEADRKKEGLLWALSRPGSHADPKGLNKQAWHKYWVVVAGGQLCEYSNWKQKLDLHNEPINLRMASVREARSSDRRFCFEIITPQYKRVYQATSEEDMNNWISAINNAMKSTIEGGKSVVAFDQSRIDNSGGQPMKSIQSALTGKSHHNPLSLLQNSVPGSVSGSTSNNSLYRRTTVGARPNAARRTSNSIADDPEKLLQLLRDADPTNLNCADCGSQVKVEWVSINLGIILCIECSGLHRSLGTHVSKIRSLTLDTVSFTPDMVDLLCHLGNKISNAVWEATCDTNQRPDSRATREVRLKYITQKYVDRAFVEPMSTTLSPYASPTEQLIDAVRRGDFFLALQAIALKADPNAIDPRTGQCLVLLALSLADRVPPSTPTSPTATFHDQSSSKAPDSTTYPMAEFLIQNGADIPEDPQSFSMQARTYLQQKVAKRLGLNSLNTSNSTVTNSMLQHNQDSPPSSRGRFAQSSQSTSPQEKKEKEKERLAKRVSSGSRLMRAPPLDKS